MCKQIVFLSSLLFFTCANDKASAQNVWSEDSTWVVERQAIHLKIDSVFSNLDTNKFNSGFLYDRVVFPASGITNYNGSGDSIIDNARWLQLYFELTDFAAIHPASFLSAYKVDSLAKAKVNNGVVPLGIINLQYHKIKPQAIDSGWIYIQNDQPFENSGSPDPYELHQVYAAAPLKESESVSPVTYLIDPNFYFSNTADSVLNFEIDFGDGAGYRTVHFGDTVSVNYSISGEIQIKTKTVFAAKIYTSISSYKVIVISSSFAQSAAATDCDDIDGSYIAPDDIWTVKSTVLYNYSDATLYWNQKLGEGRAYIKYGCGNNGQLRKPLVFVEGIDFGTDDHLDPNGHQYVQYGDFGWTQVIMGYDNTSTDPLEQLKIEKLPKLIRKLCSEGYDLIMLDFKDGAYYIQTNAMALVKLIQMVNAELQTNGSNHKITILGASMGGQVSRLALRYMERNNLVHNTNLWISFDSPNEGANIPLGTQYGIRWQAFYIFTPSALLEPATKQLLLYHFKPTSGKTARVVKF